MHAVAVHQSTHIHRQLALKHSIKHCLCCLHMGLGDGEGPGGLPWFTGFSPREQILDTWWMVL